MNKYWVLVRLFAGGVPLLASLLYARVLSPSEFQQVIGAISVIMITAIALKMGKDSRVREIYVNYGGPGLSQKKLKVKSEQIAYGASFSVAKKLLSLRSLPLALCLIAIISRESSILSLIIYACLAILVASNSMMSVGDRYIGNMVQAIALDGVIFHISSLIVICCMVLIMPSSIVTTASFFIVLVGLSIFTVVRENSSDRSIIFDEKIPVNVNVALLSLLGSLTSWGILYGFSKLGIQDIEMVIISFQAAISLQLVRSINTSWFSAYYSKDILLQNTGVLRQSLNIAILSVFLGLALALVMVLLGEYAGIPFSLEYAFYFIVIEIILTVSSPALSHQINLGKSRGVLYVMLISHLPLILIWLSDLAINEIILLLLATSLLKFFGAISLSRIYRNENIGA